MAHDDENLQSISRRRAKSGRVSFGDPVILDESSRRRVVLVPFFIPHHDHTELASKIVTYKKSPSPFDWVVVEEKSVSLQEVATRRLLTGLKSHLTVAEENKDGSYMLIRVSEGTAQLGTNDPAQVAAALMKVLSQDEILSHLQNTELTTELATALRGAIRLSRAWGQTEFQVNLKLGLTPHHSHHWTPHHSHHWTPHQLANPVATALVEQRLPVLAGESPAVLPAPAAVEDAGPRANDVPSRRDGWLSPIELNERAEPLTTARGP
jgi:hypothetical protein